MAILIPSKNIYDKNNPKVIKNIINGVELLLNNATKFEGDLPDTKKEIIISEIIGSGYNQEKYSRYNDNVSNEYKIKVIANLGFPTLLTNIKIIINNTTNVEKLKIHLYYLGGAGRTVSGEGTHYYTHETELFSPTLLELKNQIEQNGYYSFIAPSFTSENGNAFANEEILRVQSLTITNTFIELSIKSGNLDEIFVSSLGYKDTIKYAVSLYGNYLEEEELIIKQQNANQSIDSNEIFQRGVSINGESYYNTLINEIVHFWGNGKETATIRCSISDYYDFNSGDKVLSIDNSTGKMSFNEYDQVIPMVYGADGQDRPMSTYQDGSPKVFQVLGSNIYYDGAVWQELSLQEVDKSEIL